MSLKEFSCTYNVDDGFGCNSSRQKTLDMAIEIREDIILSGFVPKVEKCLWIPIQSIQYLGTNIDSKEGYLTIPESRVVKALKVLHEI